MSDISVLRLGLLLMGLLGCGRSMFGLTPEELSRCGKHCSDAQAHGDGQPTADTDRPAMSWGEYVLGLELPDCPVSPYADLVVDTTSMESEASTGVVGDLTLTEPSEAGPELSLREALWLAANRGSSNTIRFDPAVFPTAAPATIDIRNTEVLPQFLANTCIKGVGAGVRWRWQAPNVGDSGVMCRFSLNDGSLMVGLELANVWVQPMLMGAQLAGCAVEIAEITVFDVGNGARLGPANMFWGSGGVFRNDSPGPGITVESNYFGFDPREGRVLPLLNVAAIFTSLEFRDNIFSVGVVGALDAAFLDNSNTVLIHNNRFGVTGKGSESLPAPSGFIYANTGHWRIEAGSEFTGAAGAAITVANSAIVTLTQSAVFANAGGGIVAGPGATLPTSPTITGVTAQEVDGWCTEAGTVKVFADRSDQGEFYLGTTACEANAAFQLSVAVPTQLNITATVTTATGATSSFSAPVSAP